MPRLCCGCLTGKTRKSFPIHEKHQDTEINKVFVRHVENIRLTPPLPLPSSIEKTTISNKTFIKNDVETNQEAIKETRLPVTKLFEKSKSPIEEPQDKIKTDSVSSWPSSTESDFETLKKNTECQPCVEQKETIYQTQKIFNDVKPLGKSKLVLENVRKMIKDQNIQQQHFNQTQRRDTVRL